MNSAHYKIALFLLAFLLLFSCRKEKENKQLIHIETATSQTASLKLFISSPKIALSDLLQVRLEVQYPLHSQAFIKEENLAFGDFSILDKHREAEALDSNNSVVTATQFLLEADKSGKLILPSFAVQIQQNLKNVSELKTKPFAIEVTTQIQGKIDDLPTIKDIDTRIIDDSNKSTKWPFITTLLILFILYAFIQWRRKNEHTKAPIKNKQTALESLQQVDHSADPQMILRQLYKICENFIEQEYQLKAFPAEEKNLSAKLKQEAINLLKEIELHLHAPHQISCAKTQAFANAIKLELLDPADEEAKS